MTVKEVFPIDNGLLSSIAALLPDLFDNSTDLDLLLISKCGNRQITPIVTMLLDASGNLSSASQARLAALIVSEYGEAWERIKTALTAEYNPIVTGTYHEEETTATEGETGDSSNETNSNDVSAINSPAGKYLSDGKTTSELSATGTSKTNITRTLDRNTQGANFKNSDLVQAEIAMRVNSRFTAQVITDIKNYIAMQIY